MKQKAITKRLSILLTILMVLGLMPSSLMAQAATVGVTSEDELRNAVTTNAHIILLNDIGLTKVMEITCKTITIDGAGHTITLKSGEAYRHFSLNSCASLTLKNVTLKGNSGVIGGGVSLKNSKLIMEQSTIECCKADRLGGGVYADTGSQVDLSGDSTIENCTAMYGAGVYADNASVDLREGSGILTCTAEYGGGVYCYNNAVLRLTGDCEIKNCGAKTGGGVTASKGSVELSDGSGIINCTADKGGGVYLTGSAGIKSDETTRYDGNMASTAYEDKGDPNVQYACTSIIKSYENGPIYAEPINGYDICIYKNMNTEQAVCTLTWVESGNADAPSVSQNIYKDLTCSLPDAASFGFAQENQILLGWSFEQDSEIHNPGDPFKFDKDYTFYGVWAAIEDQPKASIDFICETLTELDANGAYTINDTPYHADENGEIEIDATWFKKTLSIVKTGVVSGTNSVPLNLEIPARPGVPSVIGVNETKQGKNDGKITGTGSAMEYSTDELEWTTCPDADMENLAAGTYYVRVKATNKSFKSEAAKVVIESGNEEPQGVIHYPYIAGYEDDTFRPNDTVTRAEAAQLLYNISGETAAGTNIFNDVFPDDWYYEAVTYLTDIGVISGYSDDTFRPDNDITRAEFVTLAAKFAELSPAAESSFSDVPSYHWAYGYISAAHNAGWVSGCPGGTFEPERFITRAEAVVVLNAMQGRAIDEAALADLTMPFTDVPITHWAYYQILEAAVEHEHK